MKIIKEIIYSSSVEFLVTIESDFIIVKIYICCQLLNDREQNTSNYWKAVIG